MFDFPRMWPKCHSLCRVGVLICKWINARKWGLHMKKLLLAGTALGGLALAGPALAADIPVKAPPPVVAPAFTWTGCYIGGNVGGAAGQKEWDNFTGSFFNGLFGGRTSAIVVITTTGTEVVEGFPALNRITSISDDTHGFLAGGQVGCDYQ